MQNAECRIQALRADAPDWSKRPARIICILHPAFCIVVLVVTAACGRGDQPAPSVGSSPLREIVLPDLSGVDAPVQDQIRARHTALTQLIAARPPTRELATAYGEYGMLLHAAEYYDAAEPAYLNARQLAADDPRWPYYLAQVYRHRGQTEAAIAAFTRVLELKPDDVATLIWLGRLYLDHGEAEKAEALFSKAQSAAPDAVAARIGRGQAALALKDYARAVEQLEGALEINPGIASAYAPLAVAYRGLGQIEKADTLQQHWRNTEVSVPDPMMSELNVVLQSGLAYELRGVRALDSGEYVQAAQLFRQGLALVPPNSLLARSLRHKLGTALAVSGDVTAAVKEFETTLRSAPRSGMDEPSAKASYSLGVLLASRGRTDQAIARLNDAVRYNPSYLEAHLVLGDVLRRSGRFAAAKQHYEQALRINPRSSDARRGLEMSTASRRD